MLQTQRGQKPRVEQKGKSSLDFDFFKRDFGPSDQGESSGQGKSQGKSLQTRESLQTRVSVFRPG